MASGGDDFPSHPVELHHLGDAHVQTPEPAKLEDLVSQDENPFVPLMSRPSSKEGGFETSMKNLSMKVRMPIVSNPARLVSREPYIQARSLLCRVHNTKIFHLEVVSINLNLIIGRNT